MSRTDNTNPFMIQIADMNGINRGRTKLVVLDEVVKYSYKTHRYIGTGLINRGARTRLQREFTTQRRQRDRRVCREAQYNPDADFQPVQGDRPSVNWYLS